jgi:hypothetical protein
MAWEVTVTAKATDDPDRALATELNQLKTDLGATSVSGSGPTYTILAPTFVIANKCAVGAYAMGLLIHPIKYAV